MTVWRRTGLVPGIYDELITARVQAQLDALPEALTSQIGSARSAGTESLHGRP